jgi:hypothetical protein
MPLRIRSLVVKVLRRFPGCPAWSPAPTLREAPESEAKQRRPCRRPPCQHTTPASGCLGSHLDHADTPCAAVAVAGGAEGIRTPDIRLAKAALSQLSYGPGWYWWGILDSNQRPQSYQDCALTC